MRYSKVGKCFEKWSLSFSCCESSICTVFECFLHLNVLPSEESDGKQITVL